MSAPAGAQETGASETPAAEDPLPDVDVLFATNRARHIDLPPGERYGGKRGDLRFGRCRVSFKQFPLMDQIAAGVSFYVPTESKAVSEVEPFDAPVFWSRLSSAVAATTTRSAIVFVHGYNYDFERTCRMAAEMQREFAGDAVVVMFTWPSNGSATDYVADLADVEWSVPVLAGLLAELGDRVGVDRLQILAHSMGSRGTIAALERVGHQSDMRPVVSRLVLLAPDYDTQTFLDRLPELRPLVGSMTLYASSNDSPLKLSRQLNGHPRLGQAGEYLTVVPGIETIDVSPAGLYQVFGHEYFFYHPFVAADLAELLITGTPAADRSGLRATDLDGVEYWEIASE